MIIIIDLNLKINFHPFSVRTVMKDMDNIPFPPSKKPKVDHMWRDIQRRSILYNIEVPKVPVPYPINNLDLANCVALVGVNEGWILEYLEQAYKFWFIDHIEAGSEGNLNDSFNKLNLNVENLIESFETAALDNMLWQNSGDIEWEVILGGSEGNYSAKSGLINHNMSSELSIEMEIVEAGNISFDKKVSCEDVGSQTGNYYDYLAFYIDGQEMGKWAGEIDWSQNSYEVSEGQHTFLWKYIKDQGVTTGDDAAWIDNIIFPPTYYNSILLGDANYDGYINIQDVIVTVGVILNSTEFNAACDFNEDGTIDVIDVIGIVNIILN